MRKKKSELPEWIQPAADRPGVFDTDPDLAYPAILEELKEAPGAGSRSCIH